MATMSREQSRALNRQIARVTEMDKRYYEERDYGRGIYADALEFTKGIYGDFKEGGFGAGIGVDGTGDGAYAVPELPTMDRAAYSRDVQQNVAGQRRGLINAFNRSAPRGRGSGNLAYDRSLERTRFQGLSSGLQGAYGTAQNAAAGQQGLRYGGQLQRFGAQVSSSAQRAANIQQVGMERLRQQGGLRNQLLAGTLSAGRV